jgi:hypothetical protein
MFDVAAILRPHVEWHAGTTCFLIRCQQERIFGVPYPAAADVALRFEDGILIGLLEASTGFVLINPPPGYTLNADEHLILLRPTATKEVRRV